MLVSCHDMNLNPLAEGSTETWYSSETEITMSINDLYRDPFGADRQTAMAAMMPGLMTGCIEKR